MFKTAVLSNPKKLRFVLNHMCERSFGVYSFRLNTVFDFYTQEVCEKNCRKIPIWIGF